MMLSSSKRCRSVFVVLLALGSLTNMVSAQTADETFYVDASIGTSGNGQTWTTAKKYLQDALTLADVYLDQPGQGDDFVDIWVANGTYRCDESDADTDGTDERDDWFALRAQVRLYGGYAGDGASNPDARDPVTYITILSGEIGAVQPPTAGYLDDNTYHVIYAHSASITATNTRADGFTIRDGNAFDSAVNVVAGGGIFIDNGADPRIHNCIITENFAAFRSSGHGAGINVDDSEPVITRCTISANEVFDAFDLNDGGKGGGIYIEGDTGGKTVKIIDCTIKDNSAEGGGGVCVRDSGTNPMTAELLNCLIINNEANGVQANPSGLGGGVLVQDKGIVKLVNCTLVGNTSSQGGGIALYNTNNNISTVSNIIVWNNSADTGDEIAMLTATSGDLTIEYSNIRDFDQSAAVSGSPTYGSGVIGDDTTPDDPDFVSSTDFHLQCGSPSINSGTDTPNSTAFPTDGFNVDEDADTAEATPDLDLALRIFGDDTSGPGNIDMDSYEKGLSTPCIEGDIAPMPCRNGIVNVDDLLAVINSWGSCPAAPALCPADIISDTSGPPDGQVNVSDLIQVIGDWGPCPGYTGDEESMPTSVQDCMDEASERYTAYTTEWTEYVNDCVEALCQAEIIECDE